MVDKEVVKHQLIVDFYIIFQTFDYDLRYEMLG